MNRILTLTHFSELFHIQDVWHDESVLCILVDRSFDLHQVVLLTHDRLLRLLALQILEIDEVFDLSHPLSFLDAVLLTLLVPPPLVDLGFCESGLN